MTAQDILSTAHGAGVDVVLSATGDGLELLSAGDPPPAVIAIVKDAKSEIVAELQKERRQVNHWVAAHIIDWPQEMCFYCRRRILMGQLFTDITNGDARMRLHEGCRAPWRTEQEILARRTIGLRPAPLSPQEGNEK